MLAFDVVSSGSTSNLMYLSDRCAVMCRAEAVKVWKLRDVLKNLGVQLYGLVHEPAWKQV